MSVASFTSSCAVVWSHAGCLQKKHKGFLRTALDEAQAPMFYMQLLLLVHSSQGRRGILLQHLGSPECSRRLQLRIMPHKMSNKRPLWPFSFWSIRTMKPSSDVVLFSPFFNIYQGSQGRSYLCLGISCPWGKTVRFRSRSSAFK